MAFPSAMRAAQAALSPAFGAPPIPCPWQTLHVCSKSCVPFCGIAAATAVPDAPPSAVPSAGLMASAELSRPAIASFTGGLMRACTFLLYSASLSTCRSWVWLATMRASANRPTATATSRPITMLKTLKKWVSCLLTIASVFLRTPRIRARSIAGAGVVDRRARGKPPFGRSAARAHWSLQGLRADTSGDCRLPQEHTMRHMAISAISAFLLLVGCAHEKPVAPRPAATPAAPQNAAGATGSGSAKTKVPGRSESTASAAPQAAAPSGAAAGTAAGGTAPRPGASPAPALDLPSLEQRLRDTRAIGVFTKLSLKNQVDDLLGEFRAFHRRQAAVTVAELRQKYDLLLLKVLILLMVGRPPLAAAVSSSREAIWEMLIDPQKFEKLARN